MQWESMRAFCDMGGYGAYVWGSYAVSAALIAIEVWLVRRRLRAAKNRI